MATFKINKNTDFTVMSNIHLRDKRLSLKAKGLLSFMLSLPDDWDYSLMGLVAICKESKDAIRTTLNELKKFYYLDISPSRDENGKFEYDYLIYENPSENPLKMQNTPYTDFPYTDEPSTENQPQINTNNKNTNNKIDIIDKTDKNKMPAKKNQEEISHNILTIELINLKFINKDDPSTFYFDNLFKNYISEGYNYKELYSATHYIAELYM